VVIDESIHRRKRPRLTPIIAPRALPPAQGNWNDEQWARLQTGMYPGGMDYRWTSYLIGHRLFLHRSWTGQGIFEAEFAPANNGWQVSTALVESAHVNSYVDRPEADLSNLLRRVIDIAARWDTANEYHPRPDRPRPHPDQLR
jgi:hypothetical protein